LVRAFLNDIATELVFTFQELWQADVSMFWVLFYYFFRKIQGTQPEQLYETKLVIFSATNEEENVRYK
jgi:hypothetical protein